MDRCCLSGSIFSQHLETGINRKKNISLIYVTWKAFFKDRGGWGDRKEW